MKRGFPIGLMVLGAFLNIAAFTWLYFDNETKDSSTLQLPAQIAGLSRTDLRTGKEATTEFESLHGKQFPVTSGAIGVYGTQQITLWVAGTSTEDVARQLVDSMRDRIADGNSPFTPVKQIQDKKRTIYMLEGMGQQHFYFQSKNLVIWLAADASLSEDALKRTLEAYP